MAKNAIVQPLTDNENCTQPGQEDELLAEITG